MRFLIFALPLLCACVLSFIAGRAGRRQAVLRATQNVQGVITAARSLATLQLNESDAEYWRREARLALDLYDTDQRRAIG